MVTTLYIPKKPIEPIKIAPISAYEKKENFYEMIRVVDSLREDVPICDMGIVNKNKRVSLDCHMAEVNERSIKSFADIPFSVISHIDTFEISDGEALRLVKEAASRLEKKSLKIHKSLPRILTECPEMFEISNRESLELLERFNAYTWREHNPKLTETYMKALERSFFIAPTCLAPYNQNIYYLIKKVIETPEFLRQKSRSGLERIGNKMRGVEKELDNLPLATLSDLLFHPIETYKLGKLMNKTALSLRETTLETIKHLTKLGREYRKEHMGKNYSHLS